MNRLDVTRIAIWALPLALTYLLVIVRRPTRRLLTAVLLGLSWNLWTVLALNALALELGWWTFSSALPAFMGVPVELWAGWSLLWGAVAPLLASRHATATTLVGFLWVDLIVMPSLEPFVVLNDSWIVGEIVALTTALLPGLLLFRWTLVDAHLARRVSLQVVCVAGLFLWLIPSVPLETGDGWAEVLRLPTWRLALLVQLILLPAVLGVRAAIELAQKGRGTPLPYDPTRRLVTSGPYSYVRNPMQVSMVLLYAAAAATLWNPWLLVASLVAFAYGAGLAEWHEDLELSRRFGASWTTYRRGVRAWLPRFRPAVSDEATLLVAYSCDTCSSIGRWIRARRPVGLEIAPAEASGDAGLRRVTYLPADGPPSRGVAAIARSLEHIHLGWAVVGWLLTLPVVRQFAQLIADLFGPTPRSVAGRPYDPSACDVAETRATY